MEKRTISLREPLSVSELTFQIKDTIESTFRDVWVLGQISNVSRPSSGHIYLTLKDECAQIPAVIWKSTASKIRFALKDGMEVIAHGRLDVYPPQGKYQMVLSELEPKGIGTLELAFRQLHEKLSCEGLFDPLRKKPLPQTIKRIALITSSSGAAIRDFLQVLGRRTQRIDVIVVPVRVQGDGAEEEISMAIQQSHLISGIDAIVITRGGGSIEDLWTFNEEVIVRAVAASKLPVISGIGHEIDITLCDLAADLRALTPSEAAERIAPNDIEWKSKLTSVRIQIDEAVSRRINLAAERLNRIENRSIFVQPNRLIDDRCRTVDLQEERMNRNLERLIESATLRLTKSAASLEHLSPIAILARGYTLTETESGKRLTSVADVQNGQLIRTKFSDGTIESVVHGK
ncbi:MAG: exodeoxyribonuclease VII large subunit [Thermoguttaceae bacterium]